MSLEYPRFTMIIAHLCFLITAKLREYDSHGFAFRVSDCTESVTSDCTCEETREICDNEAEACTSESTNPGPPGCYALDLGPQELQRITFDSADWGRR